MAGSSCLETEPPALSVSESVPSDGPPFKGDHPVKCVDRYISYFTELLFTLKFSRGIFCIFHVTKRDMRLSCI